MMADQRRLRNRKGKGKPARQAGINPLLLAAFALLLLVFTGWRVQLWLSSPATLPLQVVKIEGELKYLKLADLENAVAAKASGGFFSIDLQAVQAAAEQLPWLQQASIQRVWPKTLVISVVERVPVARWGKTQLVTADGEIFASQGAGPEDLPQLSGPDELAPGLVQVFNREMQRFAGHNMQLTEISVNPRGAWQMKFSNGLQVALGESDIAIKLNRLADHIAYISQMNGMPEAIDLRYPHGMAVKWHADTQQQSDTAENGQHRGKV